MRTGISRDYYLGAASRHGYYSLHSRAFPDSLCREQFIIKGGHICGKSLFLDRLSELMINIGFDIERYRCAESPEYLDGVYIPALNAAFIDGEHPHAVNARYPGAVETYIDLGAQYNSSVLRLERDRIVSLTRELEAARVKLTRYLAAAGELRDSIRFAAWSGKAVETVKKRVKGICLRELTKASPGQISERFLTLSTAHGVHPGYAEMLKLYGRVCVLDNDFMLAQVMLTELMNYIKDAGIEATACLDPLEPERIEHLLLPSLNLAFISRKSHQEYSGQIYKHYRLDAPAKIGMSRAEKVSVKEDRKLCASLLRIGAETCADIKRLSAALDEIYTPQLDSDAIIALAETHYAALTSL